MRNVYASFLFLFCLSLAACYAAPVATHVSSAPIPDLSPSPTRSAPTATAAYACLPAHTRRDTATVVNVPTGDSVEASIGGAAFIVRYIGIIAPDPKADPSGANAATAQNQALTLGRTILLIRDNSEVDPAGRLPRLIVADSELVNERLLRMGVVRTVAESPDDTCAQEFQAAENAARALRAGLWHFSPADFTKTAAAVCTGACLTPSPGCRIKGNINAKGEKIYHLPGARDYEKTVIEPAKGERWFCTKAEAEAAGWRGGKS